MIRKRNAESEQSVFLSNYLFLARGNLEKCLKCDESPNFNSMLPYLNFWLNFSLSFKDETFVELLVKNDTNVKIVEDILLRITKFLTSMLSTKEQFNAKVGKNNQKFGEIIVKFFDLMLNIETSKLSTEIKEENRATLDMLFRNYFKFSQINLTNYRDVIFEKEGYAYLDFKGRFIYADNYVIDSIFETESLEGINLFNTITLYSEFVIRNSYGELFYDYKRSETRIREVIFTIDLRILDKNKKLKKKSEDLIENINEEKMEILRSAKTLIARFSTVLLPLTCTTDNPIACILMEVKLSKRRQNFDDFIWKKLFG